MNVLVFVTTMLMLLSLMTYARLESYRNSQAFQIIFKDHMHEKERGYINIKADDVYDKIKTRENTEGEKKKPRVDASPRISIGLLFDAKRESQQKEWEQTKILLKKLILTLYKNQPFYKKIEQDRPGFVDELIDSMIQEIDKLPQERMPKKTGDLANLELSDPVLNGALYKILHGAFYMDGVFVDQEKLVVPLNPLTLDNYSSEDEAEAPENDDNQGQSAEEYKSPEGYYSLLDYVAGRKKPTVRVFLAPKNVLLAIFNDPSTVNNIINERESLYQQAQKSDNIEHLSESFKSQFERMKDPSIDEESLNFSVSKTNPKKYR